MRLRTLLPTSLLMIALLLVAVPADAQSSECDGPYFDGVLGEVCAYGHESCDTGYTATGGTFQVCVENWSDDDTSCGLGYAARSVCLEDYSDDETSCQLGYAQFACATGYERAERTFDPARSCDVGGVDFAGWYVCVASESQSGCAYGYLEGGLGRACASPHSPL